MWFNSLSSDAELGPTQINKSTPVDSDVELDSPNSIQFEPKLIKTACEKAENRNCLQNTL